MRAGTLITSTALLALIVVSGVVVLANAVGSVSWPSTMSDIGAALPKLIAYGGLGLIGLLIISVVWWFRGR